MGKATIAFGLMWVLVCLAGGLMSGGAVPFASTELTADLTSAGTTITVESTNGFPEPGILVIGSERISYSAKTATTFVGTAARPLTRGANGTTAVAHSSGESVRMIEGTLINNAIDYDFATLADSAGLMAFVQVPVAIFDILLSFGLSPFAFLGTDLQILTILWGIFFLGLIVSLWISLAGGRRV